MKKFLKWTAIVVVSLVVLVVGIGLILPSNLEVERSIEINAASDQIHSKVANLKEWEKWAVWWKKHPEMRTTYTGEPGAVDSTSTWDMDGMPGKMTVKQITSDQITMQLEFGELDGTQVGTTLFDFAPSGSGTKVTWTSRFDMSGQIIQKWMSLIMKGMLAKDLEDGLDGLKKLVEANPAQ